MAFYNICLFAFCFLVVYVDVINCQCQGATCVANAACVNNECTCNAGFSGEGRFLCEETASRCVCVSFGDPHTTMFDGALRTSQMIPCNYIQSIFATSGGCLISAIIETAETEPYKVFVAKTTLIVVFSTVSQTISLSAAGVQSNASNIMVTDTSAAGVVSVDLPQCQTTANFRSFGATAISAPKVGSGFLLNICGNCDGVDNDIPAEFMAAPTAAERDAAFSLRNLANEQPSTPIGAVCSSLKTIVAGSNCATDTQLARATSVQNGCGAIFPNQVFINCAIAGAATSTGVYTAYKDCLSFYCSGNTASACTIVTNLYTQFSCTLPSGYSCP